MRAHEINLAPHQFIARKGYDGVVFSTHNHTIPPLMSLELILCFYAATGLFTGLLIRRFHHRSFIPVSLALKSDRNTLRSCFNSFTLLNNSGATKNLHKISGRVFRQILISSQTPLIFSFTIASDMLPRVLSCAYILLIAGSIAYLIR